MGPAVCVAPNAGRERENNNDKKKKKKKSHFRVALARPAGLSLRLRTESGLAISRTHDDRSLSASERMLALR